MKVEIREATIDDLQSIMKIEKEMYGEDYTKETFKKCLEYFSEGSFVAYSDDDIIGFVITELIDKIQSIPYIHDIGKYYNSKGKIIYLSGFGVKKDFQSLEIGLKLYEKIIEFGRKNKLEIFEVLCNEQDIEDQYEMSILRELNFVKEKDYPWEVFPGKIKPHAAWLKYIN